MLTDQPQRFGEDLEPVISGLGDLHGELWERVPDPDLLELCRLRVAALLGARDGGVGARPGGDLAIDADKLAALDDWAESPLFDARERAYLDFTEQFVTSVSEITDAQVEALREYDDQMSVRIFVAALYVLELSQRAAIVSDVVLNPQEVSQ
jgi:alkylhydroperoxidase family enzyme